MRKTLRNKLTGSMLLAVAAALAIVSVCLLIGMTRYSSAQFSRDVTGVFTTDLLAEMNTAATGSAESAAIAIEQIVDANAGQLRIGSGREYSIWDTETGSCVGGSQTDTSVTDNIVTAMNGVVGDAVPLLAAKTDVAIPVSGAVTLVVDITDDGSSMRTLCWNVLLLLLAAAVLSLIACLLLSYMMAGAFAAAAAQTAQEIRDSAEDALLPEGDWEAMALALYHPPVKRRRRNDDSEILDAVMPYLRDGYVKFTPDGDILEINTVAEELLGVTLVIDPEDEDDRLTFDQAFPGVPMPDETQSMVHGRFTQSGNRLDVVFVALEDGTFAAVVHPADGGPQ